MKLKTVLVTGAAGYIGSITSELLLKSGLTIIGVDDYSKGNIRAIKYLKKNYKQFLFIKADLQTSNLDKIFIIHQIDAILHFAGYKNIAESLSNPDKYFENNVVGIQRLLAAATRNKINNIIFSSTCAVYGSPEHIPIEENHPTKPENPYGVTKLIGEEIIKSYASTNKLKYIILRYFNVYGATKNGELGDYNINASSGLINNIVKGLLGLRDFSIDYSPVHTPDHSPIRDYINVCDIAEGHLMALRYLSQTKTNEIINLGSGKGLSVLELVDQVEKIFTIKLNINNSNLKRNEEAPIIVASNDKAKKLLDWGPKISIEYGTKDSLIWYSKFKKDT